MTQQAKLDYIELLKHSKIFSGIDREGLENLLSRFEEADLKQGEILFAQGEPSDSLYILVTGHLIATVRTPDGKQKIIGIIEKGETVGEMGALSFQPRSLTVRATSDSHVLKLTRNKLEEFFNYPKIIFHVVDVIISRSQSTIKVLSDKKIFRHIALIQGNNETPFELFIENLKQNINEKDNIILIDDITTNLAQQITKAEKENKILTFILTPENFPSLSAKIDHVGGVFVVVDGDQKPHLSNFALEMLSGRRTIFANQYELILLHDDKVVMPKDTIYWLKMANFTLHHHVRINESRFYKRLLRIMLGKSIGLVIGGGGVRGWAGMGALKAILDAGIPIDAVGGASAGSAAAAVYAIHLNYNDAFTDFNKFTDGTSDSFSLRSFTWPLISILSAVKPTKAAHSILGKLKIEDLWLPYFSISSNLNTGKEMVHRQGFLWEAVRSSTAIPGVVPPLVIDGQIHADGGILNNLPVDCMRSILGNESLVMAISLSNVGEDTTYYKFPPALPFRVGFLRKLKLAYQEYVFPPFLATFINSLLLGSLAKEHANRLASNLLISPMLKGYPMLNITDKQREELIKIGYQTARDEIEGSDLFNIYLKNNLEK